MGEWLDMLMDWSWDAGAKVCWGRRQVVTGGQMPAEKVWLNLQMPDRVIERIAPSLDTAAFAVMAEVEPNPQDQPEA